VVGSFRSVGGARKGLLDSLPLLFGQDGLCRYLLGLAILPGRHPALDFAPRELATEASGGEFADEVLVRPLAPVGRAMSEVVQASADFAGRHSTFEEEFDG
jgi:hypothetical protein